jgi:hypothetical protein
VSWKSGPLWAKSSFSEGEGSCQMRVCDRKLIAQCTWTAPEPQLDIGRAVKRKILYFCSRQNKSESTGWDKSNSVSTLIPQVHRGTNTFLEEDKLIKHCLPHLLLVLCRRWIEPVYLAKEARCVNAWWEFTASSGCEIHETNELIGMKFGIGGCRL